jgi:hypothetical protein
LLSALEEKQCGSRGGAVSINDSSHNQTHCEAPSEFGTTVVAFDYLPDEKK